MARETRTKVGLLYGHRLLRAGLRLLLEAIPGYPVAWEAGRVEEAEARSAVDILVTEPLLSDGAALGMLERNPALRVVLLVRRIEEVGPEVLPGVAYVPLWASRQDLQAALTSLKHQQHYVHPDLAASWKRTSIQLLLTPGERRVLELVSNGFSPEEAARVLQVSVNTTKTHLRGVYRKLHVRGRTQAVIEALRLGLVPPPDSNRRP